MSVVLNDAEQSLLDLLLVIPPNMEAAAQMLSSGHWSSQEVTRVGIEYVDECSWEVEDTIGKDQRERTNGIIPNLHSTYIYDVIELLLRNGLEPNGVYDDSNIMESLNYVDNEFLSADTLRLLLDNGGDVDLVIDGESYFESIDFDVFFGAVELHNRYRYASMVHIWMVAVGFGARYDGDEKNMEVFREYDSNALFDLKKLRNHRDYYFGLLHEDTNVVLEIYDKKTHWRVVRAS